MGDVGLSISETKISEKDKKMCHVHVTRRPFLNMVPPIDGARGSQKTFCPKTQGLEKCPKSEFDRSVLSYKEIACALQYLYVKLLYQKTRIVRFLRALLNLFLNAPPFYKQKSNPGRDNILSGY